MVYAYSLVEGIKGVGFWGGSTVERVSGDNRFETAYEVAKAAEGKTTHVFLALGANEFLADALSVGPVSAIKDMPVLLTTQNYIPDATKDAMEALGVTNVTIVGGEAAISKAIKTALEKDYTVDRVEGSTREGTAEAVAQRYFNEPTTAIVTNDGRVSYADALVGGYLGALMDAPILLTQANRLSDVTRNYLTEYTDKAFVLGGTSVIAPVVVDQAEKAVAGITEEANGSDVISNIRYEVIQENGNDSVVVTFDEPADTSNIQFLLIEFSQNHGKNWENGILAGKLSDLEMRSAVPMVSVTPDSLAETLVYNRVKVISLGSEESNYSEREVEQALDFTFNVKGEAPGFRLYKDRYPTLEIGESTGGLYDFAYASGVGEEDRRGYFISMPKGENLYAMPTLTNYTNDAQFVLRKYTNISEKGLTVTKPSTPVKFGK